MKHQERRLKICGSWPLAAFTVRIFLASVLLTAACPLRAAYAAWIKPWAEQPTASPRLDGAELKLIVTTVRGEADLTTITNMTPVERLNLSYRIKVSAVEVATNGASQSYFVSNTDSKTGPLKQLSVMDRQMLEQWLAQLPVDGAQLPPPGQRVIVQVRENDSWRVHVYDGAKPSPALKAILALLANPFDKTI
jgi:hypothetical protein